MTKMFVLFFMISSVSLLGQGAKSGLDDYKLDVRVRSSRLVSICGEVTYGKSTCNAKQELKVEINGKVYDLSSGNSYSGLALLRTGNYRGRVVKESSTQAYEYTRTYELLIPGGITRKYEVTGEYE